VVSGHYTVVDRRVRFEMLYARHGSAVKAYVLRRADASIADDVVAEVFLVCWRRLEELPPDPLPWLLGVARRVLSTQRRGDRRRTALHARLSLDGGHETVPATAEDGRLAAALERIGEADRELLLLIAWDGLSTTDAAAVLAIKPATARVRLMRARRRLAHALERESSTSVLCNPQSMEAPS
jgi:RNA polymerase sigma-70 factor, ECF subfamily